MINSNFDKNGLYKSGKHWLKYAAFVITVFDIYLANQLKLPITFIAF